MCKAICCFHFWCLREWASSFYRFAETGAKSHVAQRTATPDTLEGICPITRTNGGTLPEKTHLLPVCCDSPVQAMCYLFLYEKGRERERERGGGGCETESKTGGGGRGGKTWSESEKSQEHGCFFTNLTLAVCWHNTADPSSSCSPFGLM